MYDPKNPKGFSRKDYSWEKLVQAVLDTDKEKGYRLFDINAPLPTCGD